MLYGVSGLVACSWAYTVVQKIRDLLATLMY